MNDVLSASKALYEDAVFFAQDEIALSDPKLKAANEREKQFSYLLKVFSNRRAAKISEIHEKIVECQTAMDSLQRYKALVTSLQMDWHLKKFELDKAEEVVANDATLYDHTTTTTQEYMTRILKGELQQDAQEFAQQIAAARSTFNAKFHGMVQHVNERAEN